MLYLFFSLIIVSSFTIIFEENLPLKGVSSILNLYDETFVTLLFLCTIFFRRERIRNITVGVLILLFILWGIISGLMDGESIKILLLGAFSTCKPLILYWCFTQFDFKWKDFVKFLKKFDFLFYITLVSYIIDAFVPTFRSAIGITAQAEDFRDGFRSLGGFFNRFTVATLFAMIYYIKFFYYSEKTTINKIKACSSAFFIVLAIKVKDILGLLLVVLAKRIINLKPQYIITIFIAGIVSFYLYVKILPEHYNQYINLANDNVARVVETTTSFKIANDYFPFGCGFGRFASPVSVQNHYSPIYARYGIADVYGIRQEVNGYSYFAYDLFWPMIIGETGVIGLIIYVMIMFLALKDYFKEFKQNPSSRKAIFPLYLLMFFLGCSLGKPVFSGPPHALVFWGIVGIFYSLQKTNPPIFVLNRMISKRVLKNYLYNKKHGIKH